VSSYEHALPPRTAKRLSGQAPPPVKVDDERVGFNSRVGLRITTLIGTMICAYVFAGIALISLPSAVKSHNLTILIAWVSSNFIQLILLPIIIVGQNLQAKASDKRAEQTYRTPRPFSMRRSRSRSTCAPRTTSLPSWRRRPKRDPRRPTDRRCVP
jgi:hypothetical protein